jgi:hypothetical protein
MAEMKVKVTVKREIADEKHEGDLIRSEDWNHAIDALDDLDDRIDSLRSDVDTGFEGVNNSLDSLSGDVETLQSDVADLHNRVPTLETTATDHGTRLASAEADLASLKALIQPLLDFYKFRLTLRTTQSTFAVGQLAEITATVTDLAGNPLTFTAAADRPWIDFITPWGQLQTVQGFESLGGELERTLSVRTNAQGIARVRLHAEKVWGVTDVQMTTAMSNTMAVKLSNNSTVGETIVAAATPAEAKSAGAFRAISAEYDRTDNAGVKGYIDAQYVEHSSVLGDISRIPNFGGHWQEVRTTVIAFAKADSNPLTPDPSRSACSIQVTFRDWIGQWLHGDYLDDIDDLVEQTVTDLTDKVVHKPLTEAVTGVKDHIRDRVDLERGVVHNVRETTVVQRALPKVNPPDPPDYLPELIQSTQKAVALQQTLIVSQATSFKAGPRETQTALTVDLFTEPAVQSAGVQQRTQSQIAAAQASTNQAIENVKQTVTQDVSHQVGALGQQVATLGGRVDATLAEGGDLHVLKSTLNTLGGKVDALHQLDPNDVSDKMSMVSNLTLRIESLERGVPAR